MILLRIAFAGIDSGKIAGPIWSTRNPGSDEEKIAQYGEESRVNVVRLLMAASPA